MRNSFGSYSEPGTRHNYQAETSPMVRDDDDVTPEFRRRRGAGVGSHNNKNNKNYKLIYTARIRQGRKCAFSTEY